MLENCLISIKSVINLGSDNRILSKDELGDRGPISGGGQCTENGTWWWNFAD